MHIFPVWVATFLALLSSALAAPTQHLVVVSPGNLTSSCLPRCVTHCQAPRPPPPVCRILAEPAQCSIVCDNPNHRRRCHAPVCHVEAASNQCPSDSCPLCVVQCSRLECAHGIHDCRIECPPSNCEWECVLPKPSEIPPALCDIRCENPTCGISVPFVNRTRATSSTAAPLVKPFFIIIASSLLYVGFGLW